MRKSLIIKQAILRFMGRGFELEITRLLPMNWSAEHRLGVLLKPNHNWPRRCPALHALAWFMGSMRELFRGILTPALSSTPQRRGRIMVAVREVAPRHLRMAAAVGGRRVKI
jgi:hypothetical protein